MSGTVHQVSLFDGVGCAPAGSEREYRIRFPADYRPSSRMEDRGRDEWRLRLAQAQADGELRPALVARIKASLERLPVLAPDQSGIICYSCGKDSAASFALARMWYSPEQLIGLFANTHDELKPSYDHLPVFRDWIGVPIHTADSEGIHTLLRNRIPIWPKRSMRHCTKETKLIPMRDWMDLQGFGQERLRGGRPAFRNLEPYTELAPAPITFAGERRAESDARKDLPLQSRSPELLRQTHRPVIDWTIQDVWEFLLWLRAPINPVYLMGFGRCACSGCPLAGSEDKYLLGEIAPEALAEWVITEQRIGVPWRGLPGGFGQLWDELVQSGRLGCRSGTPFDLEAFNLRLGEVDVHPRNIAFRLNREAEESQNPQLRLAL